MVVSLSSLDRNVNDEMYRATFPEAIFMTKVAQWWPYTLDIVGENRGEPAFQFDYARSFAFGQIFDLVSTDFSGAKVSGLGMGEIEPADGCRGEHGEALSQLDAGVVLRVQQFPQ